MKKNLKNFAIILLSLSFFCSVLVPRAYADTISDKKREINQIQQEIDANRKSLSQKSSEVDNLQNQVNIMDGQIKDTELQISLTQAKIEQTQAEINKLTAEIKQKEAELQVQKDNLAETLRVVYETPQATTTEIIIGANSLSEIVNRAQYMEAIQSQIEVTVNTIAQLKAELENQRNTQEKQKQDLNNLLKQQQEYRQGLTEQKSAKDALLDQTKGEESKYQQMLSQSYAELSKANAELAQMEGGRIGVAGSYPVQYWPMNGYITAIFGACGCAAYICGHCHTGIDIAAPMYTNIKAAKTGVVIASNNSCPNFRSVSCGGGYGNHVKIRHDDGYVSIYGHMSPGTVRVSVGDQVSGGSTVLGQEGSSGFSTGPHLHFEIRNPSNIPVGAALP